jgi:hypothetical protein
MLKLSEVKPGDRLVVTGDFLCLDKGQVVEVFRGPEVLLDGGEVVVNEGKGGPAVTCRAGPHLLQACRAGGILTGFERAEAAEPAAAPRRRAR